MGLPTVARAAIRAALDAGHERFAVFEDDCGFDRLFSSRVSALARALPRGAGTVALGGDHPRPPEPAGRGVVMLRGLQRTHALAYLSPAAAERFLRVTDPRTAAQYSSNGHVDHTLNGAIRDGALTVHAPAAWLCYQAESRSDIDGKQYGDRRWTRHTRPAAARTLLLDGPDGPREAEAARLLNAGGYHRHAPDDLARYAVLPTGPKRAACVRQWMIRGRRAAETRGATLLGAVPGALTLAGDDHRQPRPGWCGSDRPRRSGRDPAPNDASPLPETPMPCPHPTSPAAAWEEWRSASPTPSAAPPP